GEGSLAPGVERTGASDAAEPVFDLEAMLARLKGQVELVKEAAVMFCNDIPGLLSKIKFAATKREQQALERTAHTLKGALANFHASLACDVAGQIEKAARAADFARVEILFPEIEMELARFVEELVRFTENKPT